MNAAMTPREAANDYDAYAEPCYGCGHEIDLRDKCHICGHPGHNPRPVSSPTAAATPEVVTGEEAMDLPPGSIISQWVNGRPVDALTHYTNTGWRRSGCSDDRSYGEQLGATGSEYVVWYRRSRPKLRVGEVTESPERLEGLPVGSVVRGRIEDNPPGLLAERTANGWSYSGSSSNWPSTSVAYGGARVLDLPEPGGRS